MSPRDTWAPPPKTIAPRCVHRVQLVDLTGRNLKLTHRLKVTATGTATMVFEVRERDAVELPELVEPAQVEPSEVTP